MFLRRSIPESFLLALLLVLSCGCSGEKNTDSPPAASPAAASPLDSAKELMQQGQSREAMKVVQQVLIESPDSLAALRLAAQIHQAQGELCQAGALVSRLVEIDNQSALPLCIKAFDLHLRCGDYTKAEASLKRGLQVDPKSTDIHRLLAQLLNAQGRRFEASKHVRELIRRRDFQHIEALSLIDLAGPFELSSFDEIVDQNKPSLFLLGKARKQYDFNANATVTLELVQRVRNEYPDSVAAASFEGRVLSETGQWELFSKWLNGLPPGIQEHPEYWSAIGNSLATSEAHEQAIRAFGEALRRNPTDRQSLRGMIASLDATDQADKAVKLREQLDVLDRIFRLANRADATQSNWLAEQLQALTRPWEAATWLVHSAHLAGHVQQQVDSLEQRMNAIAAWEKDGDQAKVDKIRLDRMLGFDVEAWPLPDLASTLAPSKPDIANLNVGLEFKDVAADVGFKTTFVSGYPLDGEPFFLQQANGGGIAALDYDLDGRCDIYVAQSGGQPNDPTGSKANQLFRLLPQQQYIEVAQAGVGDRSFTQGLCVGDVNQDGFPDLLIANIGANVLLINQGDGTFYDASSLIRENPNDWTSSLGLADLDGDHLPEIIEVNYIDDPAAYTTECEGKEVKCQPQRFRAASDRIHQCLSDGRFQPWSKVEAIRELPNFGFGLIIANFDGQHGNDVFISNDGDVNHFWSSVADERSEGRFAMVESAGVRGCAIGPNSSYQACMGIAAGDLNRDGTLDLHVTNFHNESVNLFLQTSGGFFSDQAMKFGLVQSTRDVLGFGTQATDFDGDGWLDLATLNGHIYDARHAGVAFRMRPQLMRGSPKGFAVQDSPSAGEYWQREQLGRTMATIDWNQDGKMDLIANHLDQPVALLQNQSVSGQWLQLELVGVASERDAIGASVQVEIGNETWSGWQIGGDGIMCTNEPVIHFGFGGSLTDDATVDRIQITWPSGTTQEFASVKANQRYLIIENQPQLVSRPTISNQ